MTVTEDEARQFYSEVKGIADANMGSIAILSLSELHAHFLLSASPGSAEAIVIDETIPDRPKYSINAKDLQTVVNTLESYAINGPPPPEADDETAKAKKKDEPPKELDKGFGKDVEKELAKGKDEGGKGHDKHEDKEHGKGHDKHDPEAEHKGKK